MSRRIGLAAAAALVAGVIVTGAVPAYGARHVNPSVGSQSCSLSTSGSSSVLSLSGSGYTPGASYGVAFTWPNGHVDGTSGGADATGTLTASSYAPFAGSYSATVYSGNKVVASCSTSVG